MQCRPTFFFLFLIFFLFLSFSISFNLWLRERHVEYFSFTSLSCDKEACEI